MLKFSLSFHKSRGEKLHGSQEIASLILYPINKAGTEQILLINMQ